VRLTLSINCRRISERSWDWLPLSSGRLKSFKAPSPRALEPEPSDVIFDNLQYSDVLAKIGEVFLLIPTQSLRRHGLCAPIPMDTRAGSPPPPPNESTRTIQYEYSSTCTCARICESRKAAWQEYVISEMLQLLAPKKSLSPTFSYTLGEQSRTSWQQVASWSNTLVWVKVGDRLFFWASTCVESTRMRRVNGLPNNHRSATEIPELLLVCRLPNH